MTVKFIYVPGDKSRTSKKDWGKLNDFISKEEVGFIDRVNSDDMVKYDIIIDIFSMTLIKNRLQDYSPGEIIQYFTKKYENNIYRAINAWKNKRRKTLNFLPNLSPKTND